MDSGAMMASMFGDSPFFDPLMFLNLSGLCATTKLTQCTNYGITMCDVTRKFYKDPEEAPDIHKEDFLARKEIIELVAKWCKDYRGKKEICHQNKWTPILYNYEIVKASAKKLRDWGHLVFTDYTLTKFLLVKIVGDGGCKCGSSHHDDHNVFTEWHANRFMSLLMYLHHGPDDPKPKWVRATYLTIEESVLPPAFLNSADPPPTQGAGRIFHVTPENFHPSLLPAEIEKIDNLLGQGGRRYDKPPASVVEAVSGSKKTRPNMSKTWLHSEQRNARECANCHSVAENGKTFQLCSRCKLVHYCGIKCQKEAWATHKLVCRKKE